MIRTQIHLTESQVEALRKLSEREGVSVAEIVRRAVDEEIRVRDERWQELKRRAIAVVGSGHSDVSDLSSRHDDYLAEAYAEVGDE